MLPYWRLSGYYFFYFAFVGAFTPYFTLYLQSLAFSATDIAILMSLMQVMRILAPNAWGWLAEKLGMRVPIVRSRRWPVWPASRFFSPPPNLPGSLSAWR